MTLFNCNWFLFVTPENDHIDGRNIFEDTLLLQYLKLLLCSCWYGIICSWGTLLDRPEAYIGGGWKNTHRGASKISTNITEIFQCKC